MSGEPAADRVDVGSLGAAFGLRGEIKLRTADAGDIRAGLALLALLPDGTHRALRVASVRPHGKGAVIAFEQVADADQARALSGARLTAAVADLPPLPEGTYRDRELIGMQLVDRRLGALGEVRAVMHYPHADMLVVGPRSILVPMLAAYGTVVDTTTRTIETDLPAGFEDL